MREVMRTLRWSAWLGWQIETNWTDPWIFALYFLVKPVTGSLLLVFMFHAAWTATAGGVPRGLLAFSYLGNALYMLVGQVGFGMSFAVVSDREHYGMLKYIRICPLDLRSYLIGRGLAKGAEGLTGSLITLAAGLLMPLGLREALSWDRIEWAWLAWYLASGVVMLLALGLILAGAVLNMARHGFLLSEGLGSALYLLSGAIFPLNVLPPWLRPLSLALPPTYWLEGVRRALVGEASTQSPLASWTQPQLALALAVGTAVLVLFAHFFFNACERRARRLGKFDQTTGF